MPKNPVDDLSFWRRRIFETIATGGMLHQIILNDSYELWRHIQGEWSGLLRRHIHSGCRVLDAGCGYGALLDCFEEAHIEIDYVGVDFSPELIELGSYRYPKRKLIVADLKQLPFPNRSFDWVIARSVHGMIIESLGREHWTPIEKELRRVAKRLFLGGYTTTIGGPIEIEVS